MSMKNALPAELAMKAISADIPSMPAARSLTFVRMKAEDRAGA
jgi:hypothetical protein